MLDRSPKPSSFLLRVILFSILFLFFFQLLTDFMAAVYASGLLQIEIPIEIVFVLLLLSPVLLILFPRWLSARRALFTLVVLVSLCRVVEVLLDTRGQMIVAGIGTGAFLIFLPAFLAGQTCESAEARALTFGLGIMFAVALSMLFYALNLPLGFLGMPIGIMVGWVIFYPASKLFFLRTASPVVATSQKRVIAYSVGFVSGLLLLYFAFTAPHVLARWTEVDVTPIVASLTIAYAASILVIQHWLKRKTLPKSLILFGNTLFLLMLTLTLLLSQMKFPAERTAYPLAGSESAVWPGFPLLVMLFLSPVIFANLILFTRHIIDLQPSPRTIGIGFSVAAFWALFLILANVSTTVYDYLPVFGPLWRDRYWLVFLLTGLGMLLPLLSIPRSAFVFHAVDFPEKVLRPLAVGVVLLGAIAVLGVELTSAPPVIPVTSNGSLRIMTYNIQQGYDAQGQKNYDGQLALIRQMNPDVLGLQESDTSRIANGNSDVVHYFADRLGMYSYYGPKTVLGTFGIALLSRYPIENPRTFYMYSVGEQTATIVAEITVNGKPYRLMVTHLGNGGPLTQVEDILSTLDVQQNLVLMGDFNLYPTEEPYRRITAVLDDAWVRAGSPKPSDREWKANDRIDHVFVSPQLAVNSAQYVLAPTSDHPALVVEVK